MFDIAALSTLIQERCAALIQHSHIAYNELTLDVLPDHLIEVSTLLRDTPEFDFKLLLDVCGVDYLYYGKSEWETEKATETGFSRGVESPPVPAEKLQYEAARRDSQALQSSHCDETANNTARSSHCDESANIKARFATVYHLLSLSNNHRVRIKVFLSEEKLIVPSVISIWPSANWYEREAFDLYGIMFSGHPDLRRILTDYGFAGHPFRKDFPLIGNVEVRYDAKAQRVIYHPVSITPRVLEPKVIRTDNRYTVGD